MKNCISCLCEHNNEGDLCTPCKEFLMEELLLERLAKKRALEEQDLLDDTDFYELIATDH